MSRLLQAASAAAITLTATVAIILTAPSFAQQAGVPVPSTQVPELSVPAPVIPPIPESEPAIVATPDAAPAASILVPRHASLTEAVRAMDHAEPGDHELRCLASGIFYESRAEPLAGQLAVAHVIINRARSGRFASSLCGVLTQRGQFSFVRGGVVPQPAAGAQWRTSVAIARIAIDGAMANPVPNALFFHATRVSPGWNRPRIATLGNHVFYR